MPVATFQASDLQRLLGRKVPVAKLVEEMPLIGGEVEKVEGEAITMEYFPNRPDLLTAEGTGRALRAFLGIAPGLPEHKVAKARTELRVDASVAEVRPHAALCIVRGVPFDAALVQSVIDAQEKLTFSMGRRRKRIAIGIHDASGVKGPFAYTCVGPADKPFVPLGETRRMTPAQIVAEHPKGKEYGSLLPSGRFPVFLDGSGEVLSLPPVINAQRTAVTTATRDVLLDVTGTDARAVRQTIALLAAGFADRGGAIEAVAVHDASGTWTCPDLKPTEATLHADDVKRLLGIDLDGEAIAQALQRMGHGAEAFGNKILVRSPAWRFDLLHPVDLLEDVAIGHGYDKVPPALPAAMTFGGRLASQDLEERVRLLLMGHGWNEAKTLTLSDDRAQWTAWGVPAGKAVRLLNPVLEEQTLLRQWLVPSLLQVLAANRHRSLPQRLFEVGAVVVPEGKSWPNRLHLGVVEADAKADFSAVKGLAESIVRDLRLPVELAPGNRPGFTPGRQGVLRHGGREVGFFGELHPDTILQFGLSVPVVALELDLSSFVA